MKLAEGQMHSLSLGVGMVGQEVMESAISSQEGQAIEHLEGSGAWSDRSGT
jgi:hypothetical protein